MDDHPNPNAPAYALRRSDLTPNMRVVVRKPTNPLMPSRYITILGNPIKRPWREGRDILSVEVLMEDGSRRLIELAALGVIPYPDGRWSRNYIIRASSR